MKEILNNLHNLLAQELTEKIQSGQATSAELNVARQFLKDNGIDGTVEQSDPLANLAKILPFTEEPKETG
jgi:hypothetical protein|tara:strand:- start:3667 stop:3876 length:210 start_codon:yes stop_codon:yes gene_type:complete